MSSDRDEIRDGGMVPDTDRHDAEADSEHDTESTGQFTIDYTPPAWYTQDANNSSNPSYSPDSSTPSATPAPPETSGQDEAAPRVADATDHGTPPAASTDQETPGSSGSPGFPLPTPDWARQPEPADQPEPRDERDEDQSSSPGPFASTAPSDVQANRSPPRRTRWPTPEPRTTRRPRSRPRARTPTARTVPVTSRTARRCGSPRPRCAARSPRSPRTRSARRPLAQMRATGPRRAALPRSPTRGTPTCNAPTPRA